MNKINIIIVVFFACLATIVPLAFYIESFPILSGDHQRWGEFGSFIGGTSGTILSLLAFIGLYFSIKQTDRQYKLQSEENSFYSLLNFHLNKVKDIEFESLQGALVFKTLNDKYYNIYKLFCGKLALSIIDDDINKLPPELYDFLSDEFNNQFSGLDFLQVYNNAKNKVDFIKNINFQRSETFEETFNSKATLIVERASSEDRVTYLEKVYRDFYHEYGHLVGPYFRNMYYILEDADSSYNPIKFAKIFRAQLSRYELSILYYNVMSSYTSEKFNKLIKKYNILDDIYEFDLCYFPDEETLQSDLEHKLS